MAHDEISGNSMSHFGLSDSDLQSIINAAADVSNIDSLILFGSRATGNYHSGSDVDLAIKCSSDGYDTAIRLSGRLNEETLMPYFFDVVCYDNIDNIKLREHIDKFGQALYTKTSAL